MTEQSDTAAQYEGLTEDLADLGMVVCSVLKELLSEERVAVHAITPRVKQRQSAMKKLAKDDMQGRSMDSLTDLLGIRVITFFEDGVDAAAEAIENDFDIHFDKSTDKRALLDADRFGYQSLHYIGELNKVRTSLPEYRKFAGKVFEIQIRSMLQHAWAEIEHDLGYKTEQAIPVQARRRFSRLAGLLELADEEFAAIRDDLKLHRASTRMTVSLEEDASLDQDSVLTFIKTSPEVERLDQATLEAIFGSSYGGLEAPTSEFAGERAAELHSLGITSTVEALEALTTSEADLIAFARAWWNGDFPGAETWDPNRERDVSSAPSDVDPSTGPANEEGAPQLSEGICFQFLYLRDRGDQALLMYREKGTWAAEATQLDRSLAACLAAVRGEELAPPQT